MPMVFDVRDLARGWLSVAIASGDQIESPMLHRTVSIEAYAEGVRLVATDGIMLLPGGRPALAPAETGHGEGCAGDEGAAGPSPAW